MTNQKLNTVLYTIMIIVLIIVGTIYVVGTRIGKNNRAFILEEHCGNITQVHFMSEYAYKQRITDFNDRMQKEFEYEEQKKSDLINEAFKIK